MQHMRTQSMTWTKAFSIIFLCMVFTTGCRGYAFTETPITDGFHAKLPAPYTRAVVWGGRPDTVQSVSTWLLKRGVLVVDQTKVLQAAADQKVSLSGYQYIETDVLRMAKSVGARLVVFTNADVGSWEAVNWSSGLPHGQRVYSATIALRAVDVNTGEIEWSGKAQSTERFGNLEEGIGLLACHALATSWGLRNPGSVAPESVCPPGSGVMVVQGGATKSQSPATGQANPNATHPTNY
ncbi:MAG: hypothetical protein UZ03_NOB001000330 [Nitrospira sp. OLB3]|nr:MAG: hypothetical protein UZ03_NOB001000330 [Nitrospira sp. OLB3]MCE7966916.1 hypothetical protein [Nitrospira sp. NTP2]RIK57559.1 MAG: hypothetical protein DCC63_13835 [Nitrospira sp.]